ncbi:MAG TPA: cytochrome c biogenesis protein CcsA, partial [Nitrospirota bacterium]|nr:cytochrome c biogenesis protein CcsA [Nitrospirota bacterium]
HAPADPVRTMEIILFILYLFALITPRLVLPALGLHAALIAQTGVRYGRLPLIGLHDTLGFLAFAIGLMYCIAGWNQKRDLVTLLTIPMILLLLAGSHFSPPMAGILPPLLKTAWFELHVILSFIAYALFAIGAVFGIHSLYRDEPIAELNQYRSLLLGYILFSCAMIFGGIWAYYAWGTYWLWTPKELWTTIVWLYYGLYLHARLVRGWRGPKVTWMGTFGFALVMFTYIGVGLLMKSSHEF